MQSFTDLEAWKRGLLLVKEIYVITKKFPREELFALTSQIRRASTSILANMAEGFGRYTFADKSAKYVISRGECTETESLLRIAAALGFISTQECNPLIQQTQYVGRLLSGLIIAARKRAKSPQSPVSSP